MAARWVLAHTTRIGLASTRNAEVPSWLVVAHRYRSRSSTPAIRIEVGSFMVMNTIRPPRSEPAVSKCAPDSSTRRLSTSAASSFCTVP